jgi:hypothetical protein
VENELHPSLYDALDIYQSICSLDIAEVFNCIVDSEMLTTIVKLLETKNFKINTMTLRIIGDLISFPSSNKAIDVILHLGIFDIFRNMLCEPNTEKSK